MDYEYEFNRLLDTARQAVEGVDFKNRFTSFAALRVLKNAVDFYDTAQTNKAVEPTKREAPQFDHVDVVDMK
jgi:hypothetical protein